MRIFSLLEGETIDYFVKKMGDSGRTGIFAGEKPIGHFSRRGESEYVFADVAGGNVWFLDARVHGEVRPFSLTVYRASAQEEGSPSGGKSPYLIILDGLFRFNNQYFMYTAIPEGRPLRDFLSGKRYICRMISLKFDDVGDLDPETRSHLRRFRGPVVGELDGLGSSGHHLRLLRELEEIGVPLSAASYVLYSSA